MHVEPGQQPAAIRDMLFEAIDYLRAKDLITVPQIASESLRMSMMSPEAQLVNPFFLGGSQIIVSYPTDTMDYDARLQSMRGNNLPFSHATAFHEMIPGHNLVGYMNARYAGYRARIWRQHAVLHRGLAALLGADCSTTWASRTRPRSGSARCSGACTAARGSSSRSSSTRASGRRRRASTSWSTASATSATTRPPKCAARSRAGYGPLYQAAYLLGGLQLRALRARAGGLEAAHRQAVPRRDPAPGQHADRAGPPRRRQGPPDARHDGRLEVLRGDAGEVGELRGTRDSGLGTR